MWNVRITDHGSDVTLPDIKYAQIDHLVLDLFLFGFIVGVFSLRVHPSKWAIFQVEDHIHSQSRAAFQGR